MTRVPPVAWLGLAALGAAALATSSQAPDLRRSLPSPTPGAAVLDAVVRPTVAHESSGRWDAINPTPGHPGVAIGPLQWTQASGHAGRLLARFREVDPATFDAVTAPHTAELLAVTAAPSLAPVGSLPLWSPEWVARLRALLRHPPYQAVMADELRTGIHMQKALQAARDVGLLTPRGLALTFDNAVRQGEYGVPRLAREVAAGWAGAPPPYPARLQAWASALRARAGAPDVDRRVAAILADPTLSDAPTSIA
jgi:hypothetical protein